MSSFDDSTELPRLGFSSGLASKRRAECSSLSFFPSAPITIVLHTEEQFRDITRAPGWAAGSFDGTIRVPVRNALERPGELERVLAHEFTHALVWSLAPRGVPTWLNEGLAVVFEGENLDWARRQLQAARERFALADLHAPFSALTTEQAAVAYAESGLAAQALIDLIGGVGVTNLLTDLSEGVDFNAAFERRALMSYSEFQAR